MNYQLLTQTFCAQDGAIWGDTLFRFNHLGEGRAFFLPDLLSGRYAKESAPFDPLTLDQRERICPHCNAVFFGKERACENDAYPLLYANVYNNCAKEADHREGTLLAYRVQKEQGHFVTTLMQIIHLDFVKTPLWRGSEEDKRPYGNFVYLPEKNQLVAFVMRDGTRDSRFFAFPMPALSQGEWDPETGARLVSLKKEDILSTFDGPQLFYIQGACTHGGLIYSTEGFGKKEGQRSALRIFDPEQQRQIVHWDLVDCGLPIEPEWIDFYGDICLYSDSSGALYKLEGLL